VGSQQRTRVTALARVVSRRTASWVVPVAWLDLDRHMGWSSALRRDPDSTVVEPPQARAENLPVG